MIYLLKKSKFGSMPFSYLQASAICIREKFYIEI